MCKQKIQEQYGKTSEWMYLPLCHEKMKVFVNLDDYKCKDLLNNKWTFLLYVYSNYVSQNSLFYLHMNPDYYRSLLGY